MRIQTCAKGLEIVRSVACFFDQALEVCGLAIGDEGETVRWSLDQKVVKAGEYSSSGKFSHRPVILAVVFLALLCLKSAVGVTHEEVDALFDCVLGLQLDHLELFRKEVQELLRGPATLVAISELVSPSASAHFMPLR